MVKWKKWNQFIPIFLIIILAGIFRFLWLDQIPNAIGGDELVYILSTKSIVLSGHDLTGTWNPLSVFLFRYPPNEQSAELEYFIHLPLSGVFPFSLLLARIPFAVMSVGIVILLYLIAERIFDTKAAFAVGLIAAINPWMIYIGRTGYEWTPAAFFYLLGLYLVIQKDKRKIFLSIIAFLFAFYAYIATKTILIPFIFLSILLAYHLNGKQFRKQYILIGIGSILVTLLFLILIKTTNTGARISEIFLPNNPMIPAEVDHLRKISITSPLTQIYANKFTVYFQILITKLYRIFSPPYLFLEGDEFFSLWRNGMLYAIDAFFLIMGSLYLFAKKQFKFVIIAAFILVSTIPQLIHKNATDYSFHMALIFPFMILLIGYGITKLIDNLKGKWKSVAVFVICCLYVISVGKFVYVYVYQHPLQGYFDFHTRIVSEYIKRAQKKSIPVTIYSDANSDYFRKFLFYTNGITKQNIKAISGYLKATTFTLNGVTFKQCDDTLTTPPSSSISIIDRNCTSTFDQTHLSIPRLDDGGEKYRIYNDSICTGVNIKRYPQNIAIHDFSMDQLSIQRFCETFITRL